MSNAPYSTVVSPLNPTFIDFDPASFWTSTGTAPTVEAINSYCRYMVNGNMVFVEFKLKIASLGTGSYRLNLPVALTSIAGTFQKTQGQWWVRYGGGTSACHIGQYDPFSTTQIKMVVCATFGGTLQDFTSIYPNNPLVIGDFIHGELRYEIP
jgi:hypothetical protein